MLPRLCEIGWKSCVLFTYCRQENAIFSPHIHSTWEAFFRGSLYLHQTSLLCIMRVALSLGRLQVAPLFSNQFSAASSVWLIMNGPLFYDDSALTIHREDVWFAWHCNSLWIYQIATAADDQRDPLLANANSSPAHPSVWCDIFMGNSPAKKLCSAGSSGLRRGRGSHCGAKSSRRASTRWDWRRRR